MSESALQELLKAPGLNDREKQTLFQSILSTKFRMIKEAAEVYIAVAEKTVDALIYDDIEISQDLMQPSVNKAAAENTFDTPIFNDIEIS